MISPTHFILYIFSGTEIVKKERLIKTMVTAAGAKRDDYRKVMGLQVLDSDDELEETKE